jgi:hypothetical protein
VPLVIALDSFFSSENPDHQPPKKRTIQPGDAIEDTTYTLGFEIVKF